MEPEFVEQVRGMDGIEKVLPIYVYQNQMQANGITLSRVEATDNLEWLNHQKKPILYLGELRPRGYTIRRR